MAVLLELALIVLAFGGMAIVFGWQEAAEWRRLVARADEVLARERAPVHVEVPELREAA
jgi:hypothetical protein